MAIRSLLSAKLKALSTHLAISLAIFAALLYLILFHWYPGVYFELDGGWQGVRIMLFVDVVLGPALTFLVYNPAKSRGKLLLDFSVIGAIQAAALAVGVYAVHAQRPLAMVFYERSFSTLQMRALEKQSTSVEVLRPFGETLPVMVYAAADTPDQKALTVVRALTQELSEFEQVDLYKPLAGHLDSVFAQQIDLDALLKADPQAQRRLDRFLERHGGTRKDYRYVRFDGRYNQATLILSPDGKVLGSLPALP